MNDYFEIVFNNPQKMCDTNLPAKIDSIKDSGDIFKVTFQMDNFIYKDIAIIKGKIFPNPKINNNINIEKIYYKYDDNFNLRLYVDAKNTNDFNNKENDSINETLDFGEECITKTLKSYFKIGHDLITNLFIVDSVNANDYSIKCMKNNRTFTLPKNNALFDQILNDKDILLINDYTSEQEQSNINLSLISIVEKLTDEKLFYILENDKRIKNNIYLWGKVLEVSKDNKNVIIMNNNKQILKFINHNNNDIKIGQFFLFSDYNIDNENNITLNKDSFYYFSSQEVYFSDRIKLNLYSVIQFYFLDYKNKDNNIFNVIKIGKDQTKIQNNKMDFILEKHKIKHFEIYTEKITLLKSETDIFSNYIYDISIYQGFINKINTFINYIYNYSYYYEYLYYSYIGQKFLDYKEIVLNDEKKKICIYDDFGSKNRRKFNILNIPYQNECKNGELVKIKSKLICETFYENSEKSKIYGVFNLFEIVYIFMNALKSTNDEFDEYYDIFGNIYDYLKQDINDQKELVDFAYKCKQNYEKYSEKLNSLNFENYNEKISLSQLKAKIGIILSSYMVNLVKPTYSLSYNYRNIKDKIQSFVKSIGMHENELSKDQILRLIIASMKRQFQGKVKAELIFLSDFNEDSSPYIMAKKFNLSEIENINEFSKLFSGYLQMDSYILYNYFDDVKSKSYSFSLEPIFITKNNLITNYEDFIISEENNDDILAITEIETRITCINAKKLFQRSNEPDVLSIENNTSLKNHSFGVSIVFRHERNSHQKKNLKSSKITSPRYYCNNGIIKKIDYLEDGNVLVGEDGNLIESLIIEDRTMILSLAKDFIYGELFDIKYFIGDNFSELIEKARNIRDKNKDYFNKFESKPNKEDKMKDLIENKRLIKEKIFELFKNNEIRIADQIYSLNLIKDIINFETKNNHYDELPSIFKMIDEELKKNKDS